MTSSVHTEQAAGVMVQQIDAFTEHVGLVIRHVGAMQQHSTNEQDKAFVVNLSMGLGQEFAALLEVHMKAMASLASLAMVRERLEGGASVKVAIKHLPGEEELGVLRRHKEVSEAIRRFNAQIGLFKMTKSGEMGFA